MFSKKSLKFLEDLSRSYGPSGFEFGSAAAYRDYLKPFAASVRTDVMGNTIAAINPDATFKVMLAGHYDEIGFQVVYISDEGFLYIRPVGGINMLTVPGAEVEVLAADGNIPGVIGNKPIHLTKPEDREKCPKVKDVWVDIGAEDKKAAEALVSIGDPVAFKANYRRLGDYRIMSKGLDDKIGAFTIAEAFRELSQRNLKIGVYCVGTVQEEVGLRGARVSAFGVDPNVGFAVDVGFASDLPDVSKTEIGDCKLGKGPIVSRNANDNPILVRKLREIAAKHEIPYQLKAGYRASGGTDTDAIQSNRSGVATALISVPNRYMHTQVEVCDLRDVENAVRLLVETIASLKPKDTFIPGVD